MYRIGICDDDYLFCGQIEKYLEEYAQQEEIEIRSEVFFFGGGLFEVYEGRISL